ncbi:MAG: ABC transporter permease [bacterium]|nr:ABC transporter permease [bacterium]
MITKLKEIFRYRQLILTMVSRDLKSRYKGTALGFFWSFLNPFLLLIVYAVVFGYIFTGSMGTAHGIELIGIDYTIFLYAGLLPWVWFNTSILESANVLFTHGNLIKKIRFPVEALPIMVVIVNMVNFILGVPILVLMILFLGKDVSLNFWAFFFPVAVFVEFVFTMGLCFLVSALTVHFRDLKDILTNFLTLWFFGTPIIYSMQSDVIKNSELATRILNFNPMTHIIEAYQYAFVFGRLPHWEKLSVTFLVGLLFFYLGFKLFDKLRDTFVEEV